MPVLTPKARSQLRLPLLRPPQRLQAFGSSGGHISGILVINLDRQPTRWRRIQQELGRYVQGTSLLMAVARDDAKAPKDSEDHYRALDKLSEATLDTGLC